MAISKTKKETSAKTETKEKINHQCIVTRAHDFGDSIAFDVKVNQVMLYGLTYRSNDDDSAWIAFPSKQGKDGKWYRHCSVDFSEDDIKSIEKQIEEKLNA